VGIGRLIVDSYAWIEFFTGSSKGRIVEKYLFDADEVYTPSIVLAEIAWKYFRENIDISIVKNRLNIISETTIVIYVDKNIAVRVGEAYQDLLENTRRRGLKRKPGIIDAIILAITRYVDGKIVTGDQHFKDLEETIYLA